MSEDTQRQLDENKQEHNQIRMDIKDLTTAVNEVSVNIARLPSDLQELFDKRYASKGTELAVDRIQWLVISSVVVAVLGVIFYKRII